jgi:hypothetical protein
MKPIYLFVLIGAAAALGIVAGALIVREPPDFHAVVDRDGTVLLCVSKGQILFSDRCVGSGRLTIVQPLEEGSITWRTATGTVTMSNEVPNPDCAISHATWKQGSEKATPSGKRIAKVDRAHITFEPYFPVPEEFRTGVLAAFSLDLNNDGKDDIAFTVDNFEHANAEVEKSGSSIYVVAGGVIAGHAGTSQFPHFFHFQRGQYTGGTDTISLARLLGVVPLSPESGEIALLVSSKDRSQRELVRYAGSIQQIQTIYQRCD